MVKIVRFKSCAIFGGLMIQSKEFSNVELEAILSHILRLAQRGYFTGINFISSEQPLPTSVILVHFLQDSARQIEYVRSMSCVSGMVVPRVAIYRVDTTYFDKPDFRDEYKNAVFFDEQFKPISIDDAISQKKGVIVENQEFDLLVPLLAENLEKTVLAIGEADKKGPAPFVDPAIIIHSANNLPVIPGFQTDLHFTAVSGIKEQFYAVITDEQRLLSLKRYLKSICTKDGCPGKLTENAIVFFPSQVNKKFVDYMIKNLEPFVAG